MVYYMYVDRFPQDLAYLDGQEQPKSFGNESVCGTHTHELTALSLSQRDHGCHCLQQGTVIPIVLCTRYV